MRDKAMTIKSYKVCPCPVCGSRKIDIIPVAGTTSVQCMNKSCGFSICSVSAPDALSFWNRTKEECLMTQIKCIEKYGNSFVPKKTVTIWGGVENIISYLTKQFGFPLETEYFPLTQDTVIKRVYNA